MVGVFLALIAAAGVLPPEAERRRPRGEEGAETLREDAPEVFLAKSTLQQYLSRVVRKDWDGARSLLHPKALASSGRRGAADDAVSWEGRREALKTFRFRSARALGPGMVAVEVGEDVYQEDRQSMDTDEPAVYLLFRSRGSFLVGDKEPGATLARMGTLPRAYPGWVDQEAMAQARRGPSRPRR